MCFLGVNTLLFANVLEIQIVDEKQQPLVGVAVYTDDFSFSTSSDEAGRAFLKALSDTTHFNFQYLGYEPLRLSYARLKKQVKLQLKPRITELQTAILIGRRDDKASEIPYQIETVGYRAIARTNAQTSADVLRDHANVFVQKSQMGGGSPVIRGFEANRVLLVVDGVRMNNAIYRNGHLQNAITVSPNTLERLEVIYGPGSLTYGSDALGGVVHFRTRLPKLSLSDDALRTINFGGRYATANDERTVNVDYNFGRKKWASLTSINISDFGDLRTGQVRRTVNSTFGQRPYYIQSDFSKEEDFDVVVQNENPNVQVGTAYRQVDILQKYLFQPNEHWNLVANFQYSTSTDVPRYDQLAQLGSSDPTNLRFAEWYYGPQERLLASVQTRFSKKTKLYDRASFIAAYQRIGEDRHRRRAGNPQRTFNLEEVSVLSFTADFDKNISENARQVLSYGIDINYNNIQSEAGSENVFTGTISRDEPTRYPSGGSTMAMLAAYSTYNWKSRDSIIKFQAGLRYTFINTYSLFGANDPIQWSPTYYVDGVRNRDSDLTGGLGVTANLPSNWQVRASLATAFRAPNLDDFSKIRARNGFVSIPNPDLDSERSLNGELTLGKLTQFSDLRLQVSTTAFYTYLWNAITRADFPLPDGTFLLELEDELLSTQANINAETAYVTGISANIRADFRRNWTLKAGWNWTKGRRTFEQQGQKLEVPQGHIPPIYGNISLLYRKQKWTFETALRYNGTKAVEDYAVRAIDGERFLRDGTSDNLELTEPCADATYCIGTPSWTTLNLYSSYEMSKRIRFNLAVENIFDIHYRPFASGVSAAGRNVVVGIRAGF